MDGKAGVNVNLSRDACENIGDGTDLAVVKSAGNASSSSDPYITIGPVPCAVCNVYCSASGFSIAKNERDSSNEMRCKGNGK